MQSLPFCGGLVSGPAGQRESVRNSAVSSSLRPWHPGWAASSHCISGVALQSPVPSWGPVLLAASVVLLNLDFLTKCRKKKLIL